MLEEQRPGDLVHVRERVCPVQEPTALLRRLEQEGRYPVVWFDKVGESGIPLVMNVHATRERLALALGVAPGELNAAYLKARAESPELQRELLAIISEIQAGIHGRTGSGQKKKQQ